MVDVGVIIASTRPGRRGELVAKWAYDTASRRTDANFQLIDLVVDHPLPHLDEPTPTSKGRYVKDHTQQWAATIAPP
jgi:NAD(P)H-dependent FMN reductase